jgi:ubiquinone/menaquinone biosynthesis C-methylase UbiE
LLLRKGGLDDAAAVIAEAAGGLEPSAVAVALSSALRYRLHDPVLRGEFSQIVERYGGHFPDRNGGGDGKAATADLVVEYFGGKFSPQERAYRSFRIRNGTDEVFASAGDNPFHLSYWLMNEAGEFIEEGPRSTFPVPLKPGAELTVPMLVAAPAEAGAYRIKVMIVHEFVRWFDDAPLFEGELVVGGDKGFRQSVSFTKHEGFFDFEKDLAYCGEMLQAVSSRTIADVEGRGLKVLELACGSDPQTIRHYYPESQVIACDLCFPQAQIGALIVEKAKRVPPENVLFVTADVFSAPFQRGSFDLVVISAALHHFSNVVVALETMRDLLSEQGRIVLLREPGKVCADDEVYIAELAAGFNEQQFELEEYEEMYQRAGLVVEEHKMDFDCSYKAVLKKK